MDVNSILELYGDPKSAVNALKELFNTSESSSICPQYLIQLSDVVKNGIKSSHQAYILFCMTHYAYLKYLGKKKFEQGTWEESLNVLIDFMFKDKLQLNTTSSNNSDQKQQQQQQQPQFKEKHVSTIRTMIEKFWKRGQVSESTLISWATKIENSGGGGNIILGNYGEEKVVTTTSNSNGVNSASRSTPASSSSSSSSSSSTMTTSTTETKNSQSTNSTSVTSTTSSTSNFKRSHSNISDGTHSTTTTITTTTTNTATPTITVNSKKDKVDARILVEYHQYRGCCALDKLIGELSLPPVHRNIALSAFEIFHAMCYNNKLTPETMCLGAAASLLQSSKIHADFCGMLRLDRIVKAYMTSVNKDPVLLDQDLGVKELTEEEVYDKIVLLEFEAVIAFQYDFDICSHPPVGSTGLLSILCNKVQASSRLLQHATRYVFEQAYKYSQLCILYSKRELCAAFMNLTADNLEGASLPEKWMTQIEVNVENVKIIMEKLKKYNNQKIPKLNRMLSDKRKKRTEMSSPSAHTPTSSHGGGNQDLEGDRLLQELEAEGSANTEKDIQPSWAKEPSAKRPRLMTD